MASPGRVETAGRDVLTHLANSDIEATSPQFVVQLGVDQVHLAEVGLSGVRGDAGSMLHRRSAMGVAVDAEPGDEHDLVRCRLGEAVAFIPTDRHDHGAGRGRHAGSLSARPAEVPSPRRAGRAAGVAPPNPSEEGVSGGQYNQPRIRP
jgi:hypothetical protein